MNSNKSAVTTAPGAFITLEGSEGAGKTTQLDFIQQQIEAAGYKVLRTREPGGTPMAEALREIWIKPWQESVDAVTELLLVFAARRQHLTAEILPALAQGIWVLSDRFTDSTYAYQGAGRGLPEAQIAQLEQWVQQETQPDLTIFIDVPVALGLSRAAKRGELDRMEQEQTDFFERVRNGFLSRAELHRQRFRVIDGRPSIDLVSAQIATVIKTLLEQHRD